MPSDHPGLTDSEAAERLQRDGPNELPQDRPRALVHIVADTVREPMFLLLCACVAIYLLVGDLRDALMLAPFVLIIVGITVFQQHRTEKALAALRQLATPRVRVRRAGRIVTLPARELVHGDVVLLAEGERVSADVNLLAGTNVLVDESLLTGESVPVAKFDTDSLFLGTLLVRGHGVARVSATGTRTELGRIGTSLQTLVVPETSLQKEVSQVVRWFSIIGLGLCLIAVSTYGVLRGDWYQGLIAGIAMAMSMIPEEFPAVMAIFMAMTAWALSRRHVLARRIPALEALSSVTTLCVDKTGTLTQNRMQLRRVQNDKDSWDADAGAAPPESLHGVLEFGLLACAQGGQDPMDLAVRQRFEQHLARTEHSHYDWMGVREYALAPDLLVTSQVWRRTAPSGRVVAAKGAPEAIVDVCHLDSQRQSTILAQAAQLSAQGLRVLAVARASWHQDTLPEHQHAFDFEFLGLLGFEDPLRPGVVTAMQECRSAGIRVLMITGDHPETARAVGRSIGLDAADIHARVSPARKLQLVQDLTREGHIVAMTGDGINDAPALRAAHVGIAMGGRGTDVAREAAALVITDDDFTSIVAGLRAARRLYDNLSKASRFIVAAHIPIALVSVVPIALGWPLVLLPVHIAFLELLIDPTCSIAFAAEPEEPGIMRRPPRPSTSRLIDLRAATIGFAQGLIAAGAVLLVILLARRAGHGAEAVRSLGFLTLVACNIALIFANRRLAHDPLAAITSGNRALWIVVCIALAMLVLTQSLPPIGALFQFAPVPAADALQALAIAALAAAALMATNLGGRR
jgi:Ca2+-transporting ATPase